MSCLISYLPSISGDCSNLGTGAFSIDIDFKIVKNFLYFTITNPIPEDKIISKSVENSSGIGLTNVKKRLELGYKSEDYKLSINNKNQVFVVELKIKV